MDSKKNKNRRRQYISKRRRQRVEAARRRWGKSSTLSPTEMINSSAPFQENASLSPMETMDSVSPPPFQEVVPPLFQEVMSYADSLVTGTLDNHLDNPESVNLASSLSIGQASSVTSALAESGAESLQQSSRVSPHLWTTVESSDTPNILSSGPLTDPQKTASLPGARIDSTHIKCETTIDKTVISCGEEISTDCVNIGCLESPGQLNGAPGDGTSELDSGVAPCDTSTVLPRENEIPDTSFDTSVSVPLSDLDDSLYVPPHIKSACDLGEKVFLCTTFQIQDLINKINSITKCTETPGCSGKLIPTDLIGCGLGGTVRIKFRCENCGQREITFNSSPDVPLNRYRSPLGTALQVAFICSGCMYTHYFRTLCLSLGMDTVGKGRFFETIKLMYPHVKKILKSQCEEAKNRMKGLDDNELGSFKSAVTTGDGAYLTRGHFSKNSTYTLRNKLTNEVLYFMHMCQHGSDHGMVEYPLFEGTSKAMEGHAAEKLFNQAFQEGMHIAVHWQDADSSSAKAFRKFYPDKNVSKNMYCINHVVRNHIKALNEWHPKKSFKQEFIQKNRVKFPQLLDPKNQHCHCGKKHRRDDCGCLKAVFTDTSARRNVRSALNQSDNCAETFRKRMLELPLHARDDHSQCSFHKNLLCSCGKCSGKEQLDCSGKEYHTKHPITCPMHSLAYEIECHHLAQQADQLIHPILGIGYTNQNEASHNVFIRYRSKEFHLQRLHYILSTNLGLLQSNMTPNYDLKGPDYHWILELFQCLNLPLFDGMKEAVMKSNHNRMKRIEESRTKEAKAARIKRRHKREHEQAERKRWNQQQNIVHTYGKQESSKKCKCGSTTHLRITSRNCPLNPSKKHSKSMQPRDVSDDSSSGGNPMNSEDSCDEIVDSTSSDSEGQVWCICGMGGSAYGDMVECSNNSCTVKWFHLQCISLTTAPKGAWYCSQCERRSGNQDKQQQGAVSSGSLEQGSSKHCKCSSASHLRTSSKDCHFDRKVSCSDDSTNETFSSYDRLDHPLSTEVDMVVSDSEDCRHFSDDSMDEILESSGNESEIWCICQEGGSLYGDMIECSNEHCEIKWFHLQCVALDVAPKGDWFCSKQCKVQAEEDVVIVNVVEKDRYTITGPLPTKEWKSEATKTVQLLSKGINIEKPSENSAIHKLSCESIAPHVRIRILGDGHCFFRALAFAITGSQENHKAIRLAIINFCLLPENVTHLSAFFGLDVGTFDPIDVMSEYIRDNNMDKCGWGTTNEILAAATLFQVRIYVSSRAGRKDRQWLRYKPLFHNLSCMAQNDYKIYLYHTDSEDHYDFVLPQI